LIVRGLAENEAPGKTPRMRAKRKAAGDDFEGRLRAAGLRVTTSRVAVLRALSEQSAPVSHGELAMHLGDASFDRVTVWRILMALVDARLADRTDLGDHVWRFELRRHAHPHFMCIDCKTVRCLPPEAVRIAARLAPGVVEVQVKGRCEGCL
jgi:Fur family transcriptional regulator, ferric uptake regulator